MFASVEDLNREKTKNMMHWRRRDECSFRSDYINERGHMGKNLGTQLFEFIMF